MNDYNKTFMIKWKKMLLFVDILTQNLHHMFVVEPFGDWKTIEHINSFFYINFVLNIVLFIRIIGPSSIATAEVDIAAIQARFLSRSILGIKKMYPIHILAWFFSRIFVRLNGKSIWKMLTMKS